MKHSTTDDSKEKILKLNYYLGALWIILIISSLILTPPDFSKPKDWIIAVIIGGFWLGIAILFYKENKRINK